MKNKIVMILLIILNLGLIGFIVNDKIINRNINKESTKKTVSLDKNDLYSSLKGSYEYKSNSGSIYLLILNNDGTYIYEAYNSVQSGSMGNYVIKNGKIYLNKLFSYGSDNSLNVTTDDNDKVLNINSSGNIIDNNPEKVDVYKYNSITLKKNNSVQSEMNFYDSLNNSYLNNNFNLEE